MTFFKLTIANHSDTNKTPILPLPIIIITIILFSGLQLSIPFKNTTSILGTKVDLNVSDIIALSNLARQENNLQPLHQNSQLTQAAQAKAEDMLAFEYWDHFSPSKRSPWKFILDAGYDYHFAGENLAKDFTDPQKLVQAWLDSPEHRANLLNKDYEDIGIAVIQGELKDKPTILVVQMFGKKFHPADITNAQQQAITPQEQASNILDASYSIWDEWKVNPFQRAKWSAIAVIFLLFIIISLKLTMQAFRPHKPLNRHYWGHIVFLLAVGIVVILTSDGNIL